MKIWIVVADEHEASFYDARGTQGPFDLALKIEPAPDSRGRQDFARRIGAEVDRGREAARFERLVVVSGSAMLSELRAAFSPASCALVSAEVKEDLAMLGGELLRAHSPEALTP